MKRNDLEKRINSAIKAETPDILEKILLDYDKLNNGEEVEFMNAFEKLDNQIVENDNVIDISNKTVFSEVSKEKKRSGSGVFKMIASVAAAFVLVFSGFFIYNNLMVDYTIGLDVNPSLEISVNKKEDVLKVLPLNEDGAAIIDGMELKGVDLNIAVNALVGSMLKQGYIDDVKNSILLSVENADTAKSAEMQKKLSSGIDEALKGYSVNGAILSQSVTTDQAIKQRAQQYGVSIGKLNLIDSLVRADATLKFEDLIGLSINDLNLISESRTSNIETISSVGTAATGSYIGADKALEAALNHAGVSKTNVVFSEAKLDYENKIMVYEVEFYTADAEYDYDINAETGVVVSFEKEQKKATMPNTTNEGTTATISVDKAKEIALKHAGLSSAEVAFVKAKLDKDDGRLEYELEFYSGNKEYDYEIDAVTGEIISYDYDAEDYHSSAPAVSTTSKPATSSTEASATSTEITEAKAKEIALNHAGLSESQVVFVKVKRDYDDGRLEYEVEFYSGNTEYDYEIDGVTGKIISYDYDAEDYHNATASSTGYSSKEAASGSIDAAKAKQIALNHAVVSESSTYEMKVEYDHDDGKAIYEVGFKSGGMEYEYDIDASNGSILKSKVEQDD